MSKVRDELLLLESKSDDAKTIAASREKFEALTKKVELSDGHLEELNAKFIDSDRFKTELLLMDISIAYQEVVSDLPG